MVDYASQYALGEDIDGNFNGGSLKKPVGYTEDIIPGNPLEITGANQTEDNTQVIVSTASTVATRFIAILAGLYGIMASTLDLLIGYCGQWSLCPAAFYAVGAYTSGLLSLQYNLNPIFTMVIGALFSGLLGFILSLTSIRLKGLYLAIASLGFGTSVWTIITSWDEVTHGALGLYGIPALAPMYDKNFFYYRMLLLYGLVVIFLLKLVNSDFGRRIIAIRDDETRAKTLGINTEMYKAITFTIVAIIQGFVGAFFAHFITVISPALANPGVTSLILASAAIGGLGTIEGPAVFAFILWFVSEYLRVFSPYLRIFFFGFLLILSAKFFRSGFFPPILRLYNKYYN